MSINEKQVEFMRTLTAFLSWCFQNDYFVIGGELYRSKEQAIINSYKDADWRKRLFSMLGMVPNNPTGILNSVHRMKMAIDLFRYLNGTVSWDVDDYREMGEKWESMHPLARWGGNFRNRDAVHFSFEHGGIK